MNILIIPSFLFTKEEPALGSFVFEQASALQKAGNRVTILYCDTYSVKEWDRWRNYREEACSVKDGVTVIRKKRFCPAKHDSGFKGVKKIFAREIRALYRKYLSDAQVDVIHAHCCAWAGYAAMELSEETGIPYVITEHSSLYGLSAEKIKGRDRQDITEAFRNARQVICVSAGLQRDIRPYCEESRILGNVVDCDLFRICREQTGETGPVFLTVCSMAHGKRLQVKGIDLLLEAFARVVKACPEARLRIGGGGPGQEVLKQWITEKGLSDYVTLLDSLPREEVAREMNRCHVFVLPSRYETFGVVYAEALACGIPVIGTATGGPDAFVIQHNGILTEVGDVEQLTRAMLHMAENRRQYPPEALRQAVVDQFSMEAVARQLMEIYQK